MCYGHRRSFSRGNINDPTAAAFAVVDNLRTRLAETEARLARARAREAELSRRLLEMKRFVSVMAIVEDFLKRRYRETQAHVAARLLS